MAFSPYTLKVKFSGLIAFVPIVGDDGFQEVWALAVEARDPRRRPYPCRAPNVEVDLKPHHPALRFNAKNASRGAPVSATPNTVWLLDGRDVEIKPAGTGVREDPGFRDNIGRLDTAFPRRSHVDLACLSPQPPEDRVGARVHFTSGTIGTEHVLMNAAGNALIYEYRSGTSYRYVYPQPPAIRVTQNMAQYVTLVVENLTNPTTLTVTDFGGANATDLELQPAPGEGDVEIEIANLTPAGHLGIGGSLPSSHEHEAMSFRMFYKMCADQQCDGPFPVPYTTNPNAGYPFCAMLRFEEAPPWTTAT